MLIEMLFFESAYYYFEPFMHTNSLNHHNDLKRYMALWS